ncbi:helix-hairpin-helix domain-containing protein [Streptomyces sp. Da 82-17]|uniref:helix-hairpin-helix domain-containing protein n=1 Tax=Streptomyces sp. Da 82-17 TaxID=3377116 RepID=UPI0038D4C1C2
MRAQALFDPGGAAARGSVLPPDLTPVPPQGLRAAVEAERARAPRGSTATSTGHASGLGGGGPEETERPEGERGERDERDERDQRDQPSEQAVQAVRDERDERSEQFERGGQDQEVGKEPRRRRLRAVVRERLPLWLHLRCGVERRSLIALVVVLVIAVSFAVHHFWYGEPRSVRAPEAVGEPTGLEPSTGSHAAGSGAETVGAGGEASVSGATGGPPGAAGGRIVVDVSGKVRKPGIHRLPAGARVADALEAAGGARRGTDLTGLNRARLLIDGEQVVVGVPAVPGLVGGGGGSAATGAASAGAASGGSAGSGSGSGAGGAGVGAPSSPISLNTATVEQLDTLPGVGPVLAQHIVDYRTQHGGFRSIDELREVNGIGDRRFADLKNAVRP